MVFALIISFLSTVPGFTQIILTEVMYDPDTLEYHNEYIEIYNAGNSAVSLQGWMVGDSLELDELRPHSGGLTLQPGQYGVILDSSYFANSTTYDHLIPADALILTIADGSFGYAGWSNSRWEWVLLVNASGDTVQAYRYFPDNPSGYPDEKILLTPSNDAENWGEGLIFRGTPGSRNSLTPWERDLALESIQIISPPARAGVPIPIRIKIANSGLNPVEQFRLSGGVDKNADSLLQSGEIVLDTLVSHNLYFRDSLILEINFPALSIGDYLVAFQCEYAGDLNMENNRKTVRIEVVSGQPDIIINEIMFQPLADLSEWVEVYNRGSDPVDLGGFFIADPRDTSQLPYQNAQLLSGEYKIIAGDSAAIWQYQLAPEKCIITPGFPTLNNDADTICLFSGVTGILDRVGYSEAWFGREVGKGVSLERIDATGSSALPSNWAASVSQAGHTAGLPNSVSGGEVKKAVNLLIQPNPFSPDGDGFEDVTLIQVNSPVSPGYLSLDLYDMAGRHIRRLADLQPIGRQGSLVWDGKDRDGNTVKMGLYILLARWYDYGQNQLAVKKTTIAVFKK